MKLGQKNGAPVDYAGEVAALRRELAAVDAEVERVTRARVTREEATARIDAALEQARGEWSWPAKANSFTLADAPMRPRAAIVPEDDAKPWELVSWLIATFPDVVRTHLVSALPDDPSALSTAERKQKLEALAVQRLELERAEEICVLRAEAAGLRLDRRGELSPAVYLETTL